MFDNITQPKPGFCCMKYCLYSMEALFTVPHTASAVENLQLKPVMVDDRMINAQVAWNGCKITGGVLFTCICSLSNMRIMCISMGIGKQSMV